MSKYTEAEAKIKKTLEKIDADGDWFVLIDLMRRRSIRDMLVRERRAQGLTQAVLAANMGVKQPRLSELEADKWLECHMSTLARWGHALGLEIQVTAHDMTVGAEEPEEIEA